MCLTSRYNNNTLQWSSRLYTGEIRTRIVIRYFWLPCSPISPLVRPSRKRSRGANILLSYPTLFYFIWKLASNTMKLLDFLHFNLTNPMVPNLAHVFYRIWSQEQFRPLGPSLGPFHSQVHFKVNGASINILNNLILCLKQFSRTIYSVSIFP